MLVSCCGAGGSKFTLPDWCCRKCGSSRHLSSLAATGSSGERSKHGVPTPPARPHPPATVDGGAMCAVETAAAGPAAAFPQHILAPSCCLLSGVGVSAQRRSWLLPVFQVRDAELLKSAGLDALMAMRVLRFGIQLFTPVTILGVGVSEWKSFG